MHLCQYGLLWTPGVPVQAKLDCVLLQQWTAIVDILHLISQIMAIKYLKNVDDDPQHPAERA